MKFQKLWEAVKESLSGKERDYTSGSIPYAVVLLAIPMILELSLESVFAVVDIFFVSKLGASAIATVGLTESLITIIYSFAIGLSTAATAVVARRIGEKQPEAASHAAAQALLMSTLLTIPLCLIGIFYAQDLLHLMGASAEVVNEGAIFTKIMLGGSLAIMLLFMINGIYRGAGNAAMAMKSLWIASLLNIVLCPIFIYIWGLKGAAIATLMGRSSGVLYQLYHLVKGKGLIKLTAAHFSWDWPVAKTIFLVAWPATLQFIIASGSWIILAKLVAEIGGTNASAGYQIAIRNVVFFILPAWGLSNAAATLVGQNLGANKPERAQKSVYLTTQYNMVFMGFVMLLFILCPSFIIHFFTQDEAIAIHAVRALRIIGSGFIFYGIGMVMTQALNGAGDTKTPTIINFCCFWLVQIPLAYYLGNYTNMGLYGIFMAIPFAEMLIALLVFIVFKQGKWKLIKV